MILAFMAGEWDDAVAEFDALVDLFDEIDDESGSLVDPAGVRALIAVHRGDLATAGGLTRLDPPAGFGWGCWPDFARAQLADASGAPERALALLSETWDRCTRGETFADLPLIGPELLRLALSQGERDRAHDVVAAVEQVADANPGVASALAASLRCRGLVAADAELLLEARVAYAKAGRRFEAAQARDDAADVLGRTGRRDEARSHFDEAISEYQQLGSVVGRPAGGGADAGLRDAPGPTGLPAARGGRMGRTHPERAVGGGPGRPGDVEPRRRGAAVPVSLDSEGPRVECAHQAGHDVEGRTGPRGDPAPGGHRPTRLAEWWWAVRRVGPHDVGENLEQLEPAAEGQASLAVGAYLAGRRLPLRHVDLDSHVLAAPVPSVRFPKASHRENGETSATWAIRSNIPRAGCMTM